MCLVSEPVTRPDSNRPPTLTGLGWGSRALIALPFHIQPRRVPPRCAPSVTRRGHDPRTAPEPAISRPCLTSSPSASGGKRICARRRRAVSSARLCTVCASVRDAPRAGMALYGASIYSLHQEKSRKRQLSREGGGVNWRNGGEKCEEAIARAHLHSGDVSCACHRR